MIRNTTTDPIQSRFDNLAQWQAVTLRYAGTTYHFVANYSGGSGSDLVLEQAAPPTPPPAAAVIVVEQPPGTGLTNGMATTDYGSLFVGDSRSRNFTIRNTGTDPLAGLAVTCDGQNSADYFVSASPAAVVAPGEQTTFTVTFVPAGDGLRKAALHIASNDPINNVFTIDLIGSGRAAAATGNVIAVFNSSADVPVTASSYLAAGCSVSFTLNCVPSANGLTVIRNTGLDFIHGHFYNLAQGQPVALSYAGGYYDFVANYYGGSGNDLVLMWTGRSAYCASSLSADSIPRPTRLISTNEGVLTGKTILATSPRPNGGLILCSDGTVAAWGGNSNGQLGDGTTTDSSVPVLVSTAEGSALYGKTVVAVAAGASDSLALCSDGTLATWGNNRFIPVEIGYGTPLYGKSITAIAKDRNGGSFALCSDGKVYSLESSQFLNDVSGSALNGKTVTALAKGGNLALCSDGTLVENGVVVDTESETSALRDKSVTALAKGDSHSLALCSDGTLAAWGQNAYGQLGDGSVSASFTPVAVNMADGSDLYGKTILAISAGESDSKALCADGTVVSWGHDHQGATGNIGDIATLVPTTLNDSLLDVNERFTTIASAGSDFMGVVSHFVAELPTCVTSPAVSEITKTGARLHGVVNGHGADTVAAFEYGIDPTNFQTAVTVPWNVESDGEMPVHALVTGLQKNTKYYFRAKVTNATGSVNGGIQSFVTRTEPSASLGTISIVSSTSVRVSGSVNASGSDTQVFVDYGTDAANLLLSVPVSGAVATGFAETPVSVVLDNLPQGTTYYYRIRGTSLGGAGTSAVGSFQLATLSGVTQVFPGSAPEAQGYVYVTLNPASIASGWRFVGEQQWRASGVPVGGLATGDRMIEFRPVPGYIQPPQETVGVVSGEAATVLDRTYYQASGGGSGGLTVTLKPDSLVADTVPADTRAQWRLLGEDDAHWRDSGTILAGLPSGNYLIECKPVAGRTTPPATTSSVQEGHTAAPTITYFLADAIAGTSPSLVPFETVTTDQSKPYAYVGQIRSDVGSSSGFVVKQRVVATAGHVVFDDGTLSTATGLQWLFQRHQGTYEPKPQIPRGFYIFDGYAAQRSSDNTPGSSSPKSQNLDAAGMYFLEDAGRGGYGGFLASDLDNNEFILSSAQKMLVGYPVDGVSASNQGRMYATPAANATFAKAYGHTYTTASIRSSGGGSGGPLCIQYQDGAWYPAAIYLGGSGQTVVRSIDSQIIDLFNRAETSGNGGDNNTGGGITHTGVGGSSNPVPTGSLQVLIEPAAARAVGAWRLTPETTWRASGTQKSGLSPGCYILEFVPISGYPSPSPQSITVTSDGVTPYTYTYGQTLIALESWRLKNFGISSNTGNAADTADPDHDGQNNLAEFAAGTNPNNAADVLKVLTSQKSGATFTLTASGKAGRIYALQRRADLAAGSWATVTTLTPLSADGPVVLTDGAAPAGRAFYRIQVSAP